MKNRQPNPSAQARSQLEPNRGSGTSLVLASGLLALLLAFPAAGAGIVVPASPGAIPMPLSAASRDPLLLPPLEVPEADPWALVVFEGSVPIVVKPLQVTTTPSPQEVLDDAKDAVHDVLRAAINLQLEQDPDEPPEADGFFDLHVAKWPGGISTATLLIQGEPVSSLSSSLSVDVDSNDQVITFEKVPILLSAKYQLSFDGTSYDIVPFIDPSSKLLGSVQDLKPQPAAQSGSNCPEQGNQVTRDWNNYDMGAIAQSQAGWGDLSWGGWQYQFNVQDRCGTIYGPVTVTPGFDFAFHGLSQFPVGGTYETHFGAYWYGNEDVSCRSYGSNYGYQCQGYEIMLGKPSFFYRTPAAPNAFHTFVNFNGIASDNCNEIIPWSASAALTLASFVYPWLGLAGFVPSYYCEKNWDEIDRDPIGGHGLGAKLTSQWSIAGAGNEKAATGFVSTNYGEKTPTEFQMELFGSVSYRWWANTCPPGCDWNEGSGSHYYETQPSAMVV